jgi:hypothetical protein
LKDAGCKPCDVNEIKKGRGKDRNINNERRKE